MRTERIGLDATEKIWMLLTSVLLAAAFLVAQPATARAVRLLTTG